MKCDETTLNILLFHSLGVILRRELNRHFNSLSDRKTIAALFRVFPYSVTSPTEALSNFACWQHAGTVGTAMVQLPVF